MIDKKTREQVRKHIEEQKEGPWSGQVPDTTLTDDEIDDVIKNEIDKQKKDKDSD